MPTYGKVKVNFLTHDVSGSAVELAVNNIATKASPTFTGTVTVPTPSADDNSTKAASTAYVQTELRDYLTTSTAASTYAPLASPTFTGSPTVPGYAALTGATFTGTVNGTSLVLSADLTVNGTTTTINTTTLQVEDKNIEIGKVSSPSDTTADGGGLTLLGATNKTWNWVNSTDAWTSSEHIEIASGKSFRVNGNNVLSQTTLGSTVVSSSLTSLGTLTGLTVDGDLQLEGDSNKDLLWDKSDGALEFADDAVLRLGADNDLEIFHQSSSTTNFIKTTNASAPIQFQAPAGETLAKLIPNGAVELYHNNSKKFETTSSGINVTGAINVNGSELSAAPTITANADGSISANDSVIIQSDGTVKKIEQVTTAANYNYSSTVNLNTEDSESYAVAADPHNSNRWAVAYKDDEGNNDGKIKIVTRNGTSLTESSWHVFHGNTGGSITMCFDPAASGRIVIFYKNADASNNLYSRLVTFSGSAGSESFTNNSELETVGNSGVGYVIESGQTQPQPVGTSGNFLIVWHRLQGGTGFIRAKMVNLSGTTLSTVDGNHVSLTTLHEDTVEMAGWGVNPSGTQGFITIRNQYGKWALKPINFSGTGTSMTMSTGLSNTARGEELLTDNISDDNQHLSLAYVDDTHFVVIAKGGGDNGYQMESMLVKYVGTTYTKSSAVHVPTTLTGTPGSENQSRNGILSNNLTTDPYTIALFSKWSGSGVSSGYNRKAFNNVGTVDIDAMTLSWSAQVRTDDCNSDVDMPYIAQQSGADQGVLLIYRHATDDYMDGRLYLTGSVASNLSTSFIGFSSAAYTNGQSATINVIGNTTTKSSLTPGTDYYVQKTGALATTADRPSVKAGIAISSTSLLIKGH